MSDPNLPSETTVDALVDRYDAFGFDSYGVLVDGQDPLPGARELLARLRSVGKPYVVATNDASALPEARLQRMRAQGFDLDPPELLSAGELLGDWADRCGIRGASVAATGSGDAVEYVCRAALTPVSIPDVMDGADARGIVVAGITGYDWQSVLSDIVTWLYQRLDVGDRICGAVPNPDVLYPDGGIRYAIGPGALATAVEDAVARGFGIERPLWRFERLGKPHRPMFDELRRRIGGAGEVAFFGDTLQTDIAGANAAGFASVLTGTGITRWSSAEELAGVAPELRPTWVVRRLG